MTDMDIHQEAADLLDTAQQKIIRYGWARMVEPHRITLNEAIAPSSFRFSDEAYEQALDTLYRVTGTRSLTKWSRRWYRTEKSVLRALGAAVKAERKTVI